MTATIAGIIPSRIIPGPVQPQEQICQTCGAVNRVAGLCLDSPDALARLQQDYRPQRIYCGGCGETFEAQRAEEPAT